MSRFGRRTALVVPVLALAFTGLSVSGCGKTVLDDVKLEETSKANLETQLEESRDEQPQGQLQKKLGISIDEKISSVDCPSGVEVEPGNTIACTVTFANGKTATATYEIRNKDADVSELSLEPGGSSE